MNIDPNNILTDGMLKSDDTQEDKIEMMVDRMKSRLNKSHQGLQINNTEEFGLLMGCSIQ